MIKCILFKNIQFKLGNADVFYSMFILSFAIITIITINSFDTFHLYGRIY